MWLNVSQKGRGCVQLNRFDRERSAVGSPKPCYMGTSIYVLIFHSLNNKGQYVGCSCFLPTLILRSLPVSSLIQIKHHRVNSARLALLSIYFVLKLNVFINI